MLLRDNRIGSILIRIYGFAVNKHFHGSVISEQQTHLHRLRHVINTAEETDSLPVCVSSMVRRNHKGFLRRHGIRKFYGVGIFDPIQFLGPEQRLADLHLCGIRRLEVFAEKQLPRKRRKRTSGAVMDIAAGIRTAAVAEIHRRRAETAVKNRSISFQFRPETQILLRGVEHESHGTPCRHQFSRDIFK